MKFTKEKWKTWWWYHRFHVLIVAAGLAVIIYSFLPNLLADKPDYSLAVASRVPLSEETIAVLCDRLTAAADDRNGDGRILVEISSYVLDLSGKTEGYLNYQGASAFDADLVGKKSSLLLFDDADGFLSNVAVPVEEIISCDTLPKLAAILPEGYFLTVRSDSDALPVLRRFVEAAA